MKQALHRAGAGLLIGAVVGAMAFETVAILFFGLGQYGASVLRVAMVGGAVHGAVFGPVFFLLRTPWLKAACWAAALLGGLSLAFFAKDVVASTAFPPGREVQFLITVIQKTSFWALGSFLMGAGIGWSINYINKNRLLEPKRQEPPSFAGRRQTEPPTYKIS